MAMKELTSYLSLLVVVVGVVKNLVLDRCVLRVCFEIVLVSRSTLNLKRFEKVVTGKMCDLG